MNLIPRFLAKLHRKPAEQAPGKPVTLQSATVRGYIMVSQQSWPKEAERRLSLQILSYWNEVRGNRAFPALDDISGEHIPDLWPWCFILDTQKDHPTPHFHYLGSNIAKYSGIFLSGKDDWRLTLLDKAAEHLKETLNAREPLLLESDLVRFDGKRIAFRSIMLPLSEDQERVTHVLGAANGKIVRD